MFAIAKAGQRHQFGLSGHRHMAPSTGSPSRRSLCDISSAGCGDCGGLMEPQSNRPFGTDDSIYSMASHGVPFQTLQLTPEEEQNCRDRSFLLLDRTLRSYDERDGQEDTGRSTTPLHHSNLDSTRWKQLKTQSSASLYIERSTSVHRDDNMLGSDWKNPMVFLMVGTIQGDLNEVMLGVETPIVASLRDRNEMLAMKPVDCAVLAELAGPTEADPFQYMGIQWMAFKHGWPLKTVSSPRDFVTLTSKGTMTRACGDRVGYQVVQPANLPQCPPLPGSMRTPLMYAAIFRQQEPGIVDVFVQTYIETQSALLNKVVVSATWKSTMDLWVAPQLAEMKKLQWCIANCTAQRRQLQRQASPSAKDNCKLCLEKRKMRGSDVNDKTSCVLCVSPTCSNCRVEKTLEAIDERRLKLTDHSVIVCRACMAFVHHMRPVDIVTHTLKPLTSGS
ncbi:hypothetical protein PF002_g11069 [Phytophthora fragariae]|nr:hypothetical protein PF003_g29612 [Phytophthora fragariae]KAE8939172.1 hypothetical protein PF009_g10992 [Phytophthora fragariae]KAE9063701.1 hypothetical protein PF007_g29462 [Phytophthora fragariae]KAE9070434.1 hypothetical protein PF006_g29362 [Phytophthora fragariae]KAE9237037.1 hypothetical protein PF002_g11069 [Phytophthora fragariae]